jgi:hypothetical protein
MHKCIALSFLFFLAWACTKPKQAEISGREIDKVIGQMTELMIHDVSNPPLAMRFYSYACVGAYAVYSKHDSKTPQILQHLTDFPSIPTIDFTNSDPALASVFTMMDISSRMQPSGGMMKAWKQKYVDSLTKAGFDEQILKQSHLLLCEGRPVQ